MGHPYSLQLFNRQPFGNAGLSTVTSRNKMKQVGHERAATPGWTPARMERSPGAAMNYERNSSRDSPAELGFPNHRISNILCIYIYDYSINVNNAP